MTLLFFVNQLLAIGVIFGHVSLALAVIYIIFFRKQQNALVNFTSKHGMLLAFIVALVSTAASLFYSQYAGFNPCELCWFQRIFMYPLVFLLGLALIKKDSRIVDYALSLAAMGTLIALNHNYLYYGGSGAFCSLSASGVSCVKSYVFEFGYVTIPLMALTGFLLVIACLLFYKQYQKARGL